MSSKTARHLAPGDEITVDHWRGGGKAVVSDNRPIGFGLANLIRTEDMTPDDLGMPFWCSETVDVAERED